MSFDYAPGLMMKNSRSYTLEVGDKVYEGTVRYPRRPEFLSPQYLVAVCPKCGDSWAKVTTGTPSPWSQSFKAVMVECGDRLSKIFYGWHSAYEVDEEIWLLIDEFNRLYTDYLEV